mmetsp:Transcript_157949/g.506595  ORF Transcript_157949/g.506595 Transcript_157949/m.506595 type:complete len:213 (+) Transcript_157949:2399-3037(+)
MRPCMALTESISLVCLSLWSATVLCKSSSFACTCFCCSSNCAFSLVKAEWAFWTSPMAPTPRSFADTRPCNWSSFACAFASSRPCVAEDSFKRRSKCSKRSESEPWSVPKLDFSPARLACDFLRPSMATPCASQEESLPCICSSFACATASSCACLSAESPSNCSKKFKRSDIVEWWPSRCLLSVDSLVCDVFSASISLKCLSALLPSKPSK